MTSHADLIAAAQSGDVSAVSSLLREDPALAAARDANGVSAVMHAFYSGQREIAELLIAAKAELDIFEATASGKMDQAAIILNRDPEAARHWSADGFTALHFAAFFNRPAIARQLIQHGADIDAVSRNPMMVTALHSAAAAHSGEIVRFLLEQGANANARQQGGWNPLHAAAQNGDAAMVRDLLAHHADPKAANDQGKRAADIAAAAGHETIAKMLS